MNKEEKEKILQDIINQMTSKKEICSLFDKETGECKWNKVDLQMIIDEIRVALNIEIEETEE